MAVPARLTATGTRTSAISLRLVQRLLGAIWLIDGILQFQPYMYSKGFTADVIAPMGQAQFGLLSWSITTALHVVGPHLAVWNTCFALIQVLIGLGLLLFARTVKVTLLASFVWCLIVWWWGEGLGMLFMGMASPLTGAPGAVLLYGLIGLLVWPTNRPATVSAASAGLLGERGSRIVWTLLWILFGLLMLLPVNRAAGATSEALSGVTGDVPAPLAAVDTALAHLTAGGGLGIAIVLAVIMVAIGVGVLWDRSRNGVLIAGSVVAAVIWLTTEELGGLLTGTATDPNSAPLVVLMAVALFAARRRTTAPGREPSGAAGTSAHV